MLYIIFTEYIYKFLNTWSKDSAGNLHKMKRGNNELAGTSGKRVKVNVDDLWDDSDSDMDDFLLQASQIVELKQPVANNTTLDNTYGYNGFNKLSVAASTQFEASIQQVPSTSRVYNNERIDDKITEELTQLREQMMMKEGECSILRSQLEQAKEDKQNLKRANETLEKLNLMQKERDRYCTELDFKNMEIVNLRRKLANVTKNFFDNTLANEHSGEESKTNSELTRFQTINFNTDECDKEIVPITGSYQPLKSVIPFEIFESNGDDKFPKLSKKKHGADERYLHSLMFSNDAKPLPRGIFTYAKYRETLKIKHFFEPIQFLTEASQRQLENETNAINQIFLMTYTFLNNHLEFLTIFDKKISIDEIRECDLKHLQHPNRKFALNFSLLKPTSCDKTIPECAIQCRQGLALIASIYPHNSYLRHIIINNKLSPISEQERSTWCYDFSNILSVGTDVNLLKTLLTMASLIGQVRQSALYTGLLCAICHLLSQIIQFEIDKTQLYDQIHRLTMEIILTNPSFPVLYYLSELLKRGSTCSQFVALLCAMPEQSNVQKKTKKGIMLVNGKCCTIEIYFNLCRESLTYLLHNGEASRDFRMHLNLIQFAMNAISCNVKWLHFASDNVHFDCQREYYKLIIEVVHASLTEYKMISSNDEIPDEIITIVKLCPKVLNSLSHKFGELIEINQQYNAIFKACQASLQDLLPKFNNWSEFEVESIIKQTKIESTPPSINWDLLELETLNI